MQKLCASILAKNYYADRFDSERNRFAPVRIIICICLVRFGSATIGSASDRFRFDSVCSVRFGAFLANFRTCSLRVRVRVHDLLVLDLFLGFLVVSMCVVVGWPLLHR